jgi:hypothetical protein
VNHLNAISFDVDTGISDTLSLRDMKTSQGQAVRSFLPTICLMACAVGCNQRKEVVEFTTEKMEPSFTPSADVRVYRFSATITSNDGLAPFEIGNEMTGRIAYSLKGENRLSKGVPPGVHMGRYAAKQNELVIRVGELKFRALGEIHVLIGKVETGERFEIVAPDFSVPEGWSIDHSGLTHGCEFSLLNYPPQGTLTNATIPEKLSRDSWKESHVRLFFPEDLKFPGGVKLITHAFVTATVNSLEEVSTEVE